MIYCLRQKGSNTELDSAKSSGRKRSRSSYEGSRDKLELAKEDGGNIVTVPKWDEASPWDDQILKPKPIRMHLQRPNSMGLGYTVGLVYDDQMQAHYNGADPLYPEKMDSIYAIYESLEATRIVDKCEFVATREATIVVSCLVCIARRTLSTFVA